MIRSFFGLITIVISLVKLITKRKFKFHLSDRSNLYCNSKRRDAHLYNITSLLLEMELFISQTEPADIIIGKSKIEQKKIHLALILLFVLTD
jgi:hypothetical protein